MNVASTSSPSIIHLIHIEEITWLTPSLARKSATKFPFYRVCWKDTIQSLVHKFFMSLKRTHELWVSTTLLEIKVKALRESNSKIKSLCLFIPSLAKPILHCCHFCLHVRYVPCIVRKICSHNQFQQWSLSKPSNHTRLKT